MTAEIWAVLIGVVTPFVVEYLKKAGVKGNRIFTFAVAALVSVVIGSGAVYFSGNLSFEGGNVLGSIGAAFIAAQTAYNVYFKPLKLDDKISGK